MNSRWHWGMGPMLAFDTETTGVDVRGDDRIVTACAALIPKADHPGARRQPKVFQYLANPGKPSHPEAVKTHGITDEYARQHGAEPARVVDDVTRLLRLAIGEGVPIVGMNLQFDLTLLDRECERYGIEPLAATPGELCPVVDIFVIDKRADPYRRGGRKLADQCANWGIALEGAHDSTVDALASARVAYKMARGPIPRVPTVRPYDTPQLDIGAMKLEDLHRAQTEWKAEQSASFARWLRGQASQERDPDKAEQMRRDADGIRPEWPFIPRDAAPDYEQGGLFD